MRKILFLFALAIFYGNGFSQKAKKSETDSLLKELAENGCKCVDSIVIINTSKTEIASKISDCINTQTGAYQLGSKLMKIDDAKDDAKIVDGKKQINISFNSDENSDEYKKYYYELERYMMSNCKSLNEKMASNEKLGAKSYTENKKAADFYSKGLDEAKKENTEKAVQYFEKAVKEDPKFAFAWDNLGLMYRKLENFDKAIEMYNKSLEIDPTGMMPLQNIAVAYIYKKDYTNAIKSYEKLAILDPKNPEVHYGIGNIYTNYLKEYEKGLDHLCKAYNIYIEQKSPYRTDAEKLIGISYREMKKEGKEAKFDEILEANNINR